MGKDPLCGMEVDEERAAATSEYKGVVYYFCAKGCKVAFDKDPEKYLGAKNAKAKALRNAFQRDPGRVWNEYMKWLPKQEGRGKDA